MEKTVVWIGAGKGRSAWPFDDQLIVAELDALGSQRLESGPVHGVAHMGENGAARSQPLDPIAHGFEPGVDGMRLRLETSDDPGLESGQRLQGSFRHDGDISGVAEVMGSQTHCPHDAMVLLQHLNGHRSSQ